MHADTYVGAQEEGDVVGRGDGGQLLALHRREQVLVVRLVWWCACGW
jgi:hypothetical protein